MFLFTDGCDSYTTTSNLLFKWGDIPGATYSAGTGKYGSGAVRVQATDTGIVTRENLGGSTRTLGCCWMQLVSGSGNPGASARAVIQFNNTGKTESGYIGYAIGAQVLGVYGWGGAGTVGTGATNVCDGLAHFIEWDILFANSGHAILRVDNIEQVNYTGDTLGSGTPSVNSVHFSSTGSGNIYDFSHIVLYDDNTDVNGNGPTAANFPLTQVRIDTIRPDGDTATIQFDTLSSGTTHYSLVNEQTPNTTNYVQDATAGHIDLYTFGNMNFIPNSIVGIMQNVYAQNEGGTTIEYKTYIKSGASVATGASVEAPAAYFMQQYGFAEDPATSAAWTQAAVNAINAGYEDQG